MSKLKLVVALLAAAFVVALTPRAYATHFRYGNISYTTDKADPRVVRFEVTVAWRSSYLPVDSTQLNFGDGQSNPFTVGVAFGTGVDTTGQQYTFYRYSATHTYAAQGQYTAFFTSCCRLSSLSNAGDDSFRVEAGVDATPGNTGNAITAVPAIIQLQTGGVRTQFIPATDPDGTPVTCRFSTNAEVGDAATIMPPTANGQAPTIATSASPPGCLLTWNLTGASAGQQFAVSVAIESPNLLVPAKKAKATLDYIIELVSTPPPSCAGSGTYTIDMGTPFTAHAIGTNNSGGLSLLMTALYTAGTITPASGTTQPSPFDTTLSWTPDQYSAGTYLATFIYTDQGNRSGYCSLTLVVPGCPQYGQPCSAGVGGCKKNGIYTCQGNQVSCNAVAGQPVPETCNGVDDNCDGTVDEGEPGSGMVCMTGLPGVCSTGVSDCNAGNLDCVPDIAPGSVAETCNGIDDDCDGKIDDGFNVGTACVAGVGGCKTNGTIECDGNGGSACNAVAGQPKPETCNAIDDNCDGAVDEGFGLGNACTKGLGVCMATGVLVCGMLGDAVCDAVSPLATPEVCGNDVDEDCDGQIDNGCVDTDGDGLYDSVEEEIGTDPNDVDSDDDGVPDGDEASPGEDTDGDGLVNALDPDSDNDGIFDGTEMGLACDDPDTDKSRGRCRPDADQGATKTDPLKRDTDGGGATDGSEDWNLDGKVDPGETDPNGAGDDASVVDTDGDGLSDALEKLLHSNASDADTDEDGLLDGDEANPSEDTDGDGLVSVLDVDSDDDGLFDGTEMGKGCLDPATRWQLGHCRADANKGVTKTSPLNRDSDRDGVSDGSEDANLDGKVDQGEGDPNDPTPVNQPDSDGDGLSDALEELLQSNPNDADSDDDGLLDGEESNPSDDGDRDGKVNVLDRDSDDDGLQDGTERGTACDDPDTNPGYCVADADNGATVTSMVNADTDFGGAIDGDEDRNLNGAVDAPERDPLNAADDGMAPECTKDADCGDGNSGRVCNAQTLACMDGCRAEGAGNSCPSGKTCSSNNAEIGLCNSVPIEETDKGCSCSTVGGDSGSLGGLALALAAALGARRRRRDARRAA